MHLMAWRARLCAGHAYLPFFDGVVSTFKCLRSLFPGEAEAGRPFLPLAPDSPVDVPAGECADGYTLEQEFSGCSSFSASRMACERAFKPLIKPCIWLLVSITIGSDTCDEDDMLASTDAHDASRESRQF